MQQRNGSLLACYCCFNGLDPCRRVCERVMDGSEPKNVAKMSRSFSDETYRRNRFFMVSRIQSSTKDTLTFCLLDSNFDPTLFFRMSGTRQNDTDLTTTSIYIETRPRVKSESFLHPSLKADESRASQQQREMRKIQIPRGPAMD